MTTIQYPRAIKTKMCFYGDTCKNRLECSYAHSINELMTFYPIIANPKLCLWKTRLCRCVEKDIICFDENCYDAHNESDKRPIICRYQSLCRYPDCNKCHFIDFPEYEILHKPSNNILQLLISTDSKWNVWISKISYEIDKIHTNLMGIGYQLYHIESQYDKDVEELSNDTNVLLKECYDLIEQIKKEEYSIKKKHSFYVSNNRWGDDDDD